MSADPRIGTVLAGYRIADVIGRGGMGVVYLAEHIGLRRRAAVKVLAPELLADPLFRERFGDESHLAASIDHPNIVPIYEAGDVDGTLYIAMRYVDGDDLRTILKRDGPLDPTRAIRILAPIADALDAAHAVDLVHRDVKSGNILVSRRDDHPYLTDFGLTKHTWSKSGLTKTGQFLGTPDYIAPEQITTGRVDGRADQYSLACVAFETLSGEVPHERETDLATLFAHLNADPPDIRERRPDLPEALTPVFMQGLAKAPEARFADCRSLLGAVADALGVARPAALVGAGAAAAAAMAAAATSAGVAPDAPTLPTDPATEATTVPLAAAAGGAGAPPTILEAGLLMPPPGPGDRRRTPMVVVGAVVAVIAGIALSGTILAGVLAPSARPTAPLLAETVASPTPQPSPSPLGSLGGASMSVGPDPFASGSAPVASASTLVAPAPSVASIPSPKTIVTPRPTVRVTPKPTAKPTPKATPDPNADCTVRGTNGDDKLIGTNGNDIICGFGGNDAMYPQGGNDVIRGGSGDSDTAYWDDSPNGVTVNLSTKKVTGWGTDTMSSVEEVFGSNHDDVVIGSSGRDVVYMNAGDDVINGAGGNDRLHGDSGNDQIDGGSGTDHLDGGPDDDTCTDGEDLIRCESPSPS